MLNNENAEEKVNFNNRISINKERVLSVQNDTLNANKLMSKLLMREDLLLCTDCSNLATPFSLADILKEKKFARQNMLHCKNLFENCPLHMQKILQTRYNVCVEHQ